MWKHAADDGRFSALSLQLAKGLELADAVKEAHGAIGQICDLIDELTAKCGQEKEIPLNELDDALLEKLGYGPHQVITTLENKMKCGFGHCGRCNIGSFYVCRDGPVFRFDTISRNFGIREL